MRKARILIVDDDENNVELLTAKLGVNGYETDNARDGMDALKKVESFNPELIILDVMMPRMDGYEVCRRLKANEKTRYIPVIMLTAKGEIEDKVMGLDIGAEDYISKPCSLIELSARVRSHLYTRMLQTRLAEVEKIAALGHLVDGIAHEVRNPLMTIGGLARRLKDKITDEHLQGQFNLIIQQVERLEKMVARIDEFKKCQHSELKKQDLNEVMKDALNGIRDAAGQKSIEIRVTPRHDMPPIMLDKDNLKTALSNIMQNSIDAMGKGGLMEVKTALTDAGFAEILIKDTGSGIKSEDLKNIFNPFYTTRTTGAGLGLTIAHNIIEDHHGEIAVESEEGKCTSVSIKLPLSV